MNQYKNLVRKIRSRGHAYGDRTGTGCRGIFGHQMHFNLADGFPIVTLKYTWMKGVVHELLWMLRGETNIQPLVDAGVHIWDAWADEDGELGPVYGAQWRNWKIEDTAGTIDQISDLITALRDNPFSRRHVITAWNPTELPVDAISPRENVQAGLMALAPCHCLFQFHVRQDRNGERILDCQLYQRSADVFLGVPFNIASYALLTHMLAYHLGYKPGKFVWTGGDCHLYDNHIEQADLLLTRDPLPLPELHLNYPAETPLWDVDPEKIALSGYKFHPPIKAPVAV